MGVGSSSCCLWARRLIGHCHNTDLGVNRNLKILADVSSSCWIWPTRTPKRQDTERVIALNSGAQSQNTTVFGPLGGLEPQDISIVIVAHGDRGGPDRDTHRNQALEQHRQRLEKANIFRSVDAGVLKGQPVFEDALARATAKKAKAVVIYPFFMADGYFVKKVLRERLEATNLSRPHTILKPLGLDPGLVGLIVKSALRHAAIAQFRPNTARLLLAGHGSKFGPASANATRAAALRITTEHAATFSEVDVAFLEEPPFLSDQLNATQSAHRARQTIVSGFFNGDGLHAGEDVPTTLQSATCPTIYTGPIGAEPLVADLIKAAVLDATKVSKI